MTNVTINNETNTFINSIFSYLIFKHRIKSIKHYELKKELGIIDFISNNKIYTLGFDSKGIFYYIYGVRNKVTNKLDLNRFFEEAKIERNSQLPLPFVRALGKYYSNDQNVNAFINEYNKYGKYKLDENLLEGIKSFFTMKISSNSKAKIKNLLGSFSQFKLKEIRENYIALTYKNIVFVYHGNKVTLVYNNTNLTEISPLSHYSNLEDVFKAVNLTENDLHLILELQIAMSINRWDYIENVWSEDDGERMTRTSIFIENPKVKYQLIQSRMRLSVIDENGINSLRIETPKGIWYLNTRSIRTVEPLDGMEEPMDIIYNNEKGKAIIKDTINFIQTSSIGLDLTQKDILSTVISKSWNRNTKI